MDDGVRRGPRQVNHLQGAAGPDCYFAKRSGSLTDVLTGLDGLEIVEDLGF